MLKTTFAGFFSIAISSTSDIRNFNFAKYLTVLSQIHTLFCKYELVCEKNPQQTCMYGVYIFKESMRSKNITHITYNKNKINTYFHLVLNVFYCTETITTYTKHTS